MNSGHKLRAWALLLAHGGVVMGGVSSAAQGSDRDSPPPPRTYENACATCHDNGGFGVRVIADRSEPERALIHNGTTLPAAAIHAIVRNGLGAMPAMSKVEVSDAELEVIIAQLISSRKSGAK
jgi:cytochrome c5